MTAPPRYHTIREIHDAFDQGRTTPLELTRTWLDLAHKDTTNSVLRSCDDRALKQAEAATAELKAGGKVPRAKKPLFGIPLGIKDNLVIEGVRTTCASRVLENYLPPYTSTAVARLESAGAISLAKLNLDEFAMGGSNENSAFGSVKHPTHPDRVPGGSSGGSAVSVRAGFCQASLGSDTGGSIRLPAAYCGVVGVKPTYGRISRYGLVAFASSLDQIGPLAQSVEDAAILLDVMTGHDPLDSTSVAGPGRGQATRCAATLATAPDFKKFRIGVPDEFFAGGLSPDVDKAVRGALKWFESQGATLVPVSLPHSKYAIAVYYVVAVSEASSNLARFDGVRFGVRPPEAAEAGDLLSFYKKVRAGFGPEVKRRIILGTFALSSGYADAYYKRACQVRRLIQQDFTQAFQKVDLIMSPVSTTPAFKLGEKASDPLQMYLNDLFTIPANLAGIPAMSLPCGVAESGADQGLPIGLQIMAPAFAEEKMLAVAHAFEKERA